MAEPTHRRRALAMVLMVVGFLLSPLSWWNDLLVNLPLAVLMAWPLRAWSETAFEAGVAAAYVFTNVLGLWLMHVGARGAANHAAQPTRTQLMRDAAFGVVYAVVVGLLFRSGLLPIPRP